MNKKNRKNGENYGTNKMCFVFVTKNLGWWNDVQDLSFLLLDQNL
jgi:hypothetical protein